MNTTRILIDMPMKLGRKVVLLGEDGQYRRDESWYTSTRQIFASLGRYLQSRSLLANDVPVEPIEEFVLHESDLTSEGMSLWKSGAVYRWLGSFDKSPAKKLDNWKILDRALQTAGSTIPGRADR